MTTKPAHTTSDPRYTTAIDLGRLFETDPHENAWGGWDVRVDWDGATIRLMAEDGEWDAGVRVVILNRTGVCLADARIDAGGLTPRFVAEFASSLHREVAER